MKKFKVIISIILILAILSGGAFCVFHFWKKESNAKIITTIFPIYDICREVLGGSDDILLLHDTGTDMHSYQPSVHDIVTISSAELFFYIGGESDEWVGDIIRSSKNNNLTAVALIDSVEKIVEGNANVIDDSHNHSHDHSEHKNHSQEIDEHIWLSIRNMITMTEVITEHLLDVFPERVGEIKQNSDTYLGKLKQLENEYNSVLNNSLQTIIIADRFPFIYLANDYNFKYIAAFSGCSADTEASTETIAHLIDEVNHHNAKYVLVLENSDRKVAERIIKDSSCQNDIEILTINTCQSVGRKDVQSASYIEIMKSNLVNFRKVVNL